MAEQVKQRINGARLAIAFAAAAVIAGGAASATGAPSKELVPNNSVSSQEVKNGTLLAKDFKAGQIYSKASADTTFLKTKTASAKFLKSEDAASTYLKQSLANSTFLKTDEATQKYLKKSEAESTYLKSGGPIPATTLGGLGASEFVQGDGSVFTGVATVPEDQATDARFSLTASSRSPPRTTTGRTRLRSRT